MNVLVLGASGLIGSHVTTALRLAGHEVTGVGRRQPASTDAHHWQVIDFDRMTTPEAWLPLLDSIDAVVNCVGIIREPRPGDFDLLHRAVPVALFAACEQRSVPRVIQVSALGSAETAPTPYWRTKGAAETDLLQRQLNATILRPSIVYGPQGASSKMFRMLATLPMLAMPFARRARVQPIHAADLAEVVVKLITMQEGAPKVLATVGPRDMTMAEYLEDLRSGMQAAPGMVLDLPDVVSSVMGRVAQLDPASALTPDALKMLEESQSGSNTADASDVTTVLGRTPRDPDTFATPADKAPSVLAWALPACRFAVALVWLWMACVCWVAWSTTGSRTWLESSHVTRWPPDFLLVSSALAAVIGLMLAFYPRRWLWPLQIVLVLAYTWISSSFVPGLWLLPFGSLSLVLPLLLMQFVMWRLTDNPAPTR
ncbi:SDR family oxidoreductase [Leeia oryzae]|uniref:SDR family oxidoreductase n=1 Tax=Leeia oryzae TaxID=356662 RepID=UPI00035F8930|nr:SDR family oxidoreductase [Leeia oryzae]